MFYRCALVGVAFDAKPHQQLDCPLRRLGKGMSWAAMDRHHSPHSVSVWHCERS